MSLVDRSNLIRISIHALHEESDGGFVGFRNPAMISIHALHEESDDVIAFHALRPVDFNPRSP